MTTAVVASLLGVAVVLLGSAATGVVRPRRYATTLDFYVAARAVGPWRNGAAISSEYTSAVSCLSLAGLIALHGVPMLWYSVGATGGYVVVLILVVAPLRRSGTYTLSDFAQWRLGSPLVRRLVTGIVTVIGMIYLVAQLQAAGVVLHLVTGLPPWAGGVATAVAAVAVALTAGMGSVTGLQALQFWLKLLIFAGCALVLWSAWRWGMAAPPAVPVPPALPRPVQEHVLAGTGDPSPLGVLSVLVSCALGAMGLPHVIVRVYASPDGRSARRSVVAALAMLVAFYLLPPVYGVLGRVFAPGVPADAMVLVLPARMLPGPVGDALTGLLAAGAFAAFLATSCGVLVALGATLSPGTPRMARIARITRIGRFRGSVAGAALTALLLSWAAPHGSVILLVMLGFGLSAATLCPVLVLGIWWRGLSARGAAAGLMVGGGLIAVLVAVEGLAPAALVAGLGLPVRYPAPFVAPVAFLVMVAVSLATPGSVPAGVSRKLARMHLPEDLGEAGIDRSSRRPGRSSR